MGCRMINKTISLVVVCVLYVLLCIGASSAGPWWNSDWDYKIETNINNETFPYQIPVTVHSGEGINNATDVFMYNNINSDFSDIRFLLNDTTELSYFIGDNSTDPIRVYVNVTANGTVGLYYGNPTAQDNSNGNDTFPWFDDFEDGDHTGRWSNTAGTLTETGGYLDYIPVSGKYNGAYTTYTLGTSDAWKLISSSQKTTNELKDMSIGQVGVEDAGNKLNDRIFMQSSPTYLSFEVYDTSLSTTATTTASSLWYTTPLITEIGKVTGKGKLSIFTEGGSLLDSVDVVSQIPDSTQPFGIYGANPGSQHIRLYWFAVANYTLYEPELSWSTQLPNTPPTVPTINHPINESTHLSLDTGIMKLNVSSTDAEGNDITYHFYGDQVDGSTFLGTNDSVDGSTHNWSITQYGVYYWKVYAADYMNNSDFTAIQEFTLIIPPNLTAPINTSTTYTTYPPLTSLISFTWQDLAAPQYRLVIAEDINFNVVSVDTHVGTNNSNQDLIVNREYFWKVYSYDGITYSNISDVYSFNLTGNSTLTGSAIEGVVYKANGDVSAIAGAEVTIWNSTWSSSMITGSNGYYVFEDLNDETVYNLQAKSDRYWDSSIALVTAESNPVTNNFYLITDLTDTEWWHYVEFTLQNVWGVTYQDVATTVYIGDSPTISESGYTESDGTISFHLNQNVQYHITFINSTLGINEDITLYPVATSYTVYIDSYSFDLPDTVTDDIQAYITSSRINATHGYINFTWSDTSGLTSSINYYIHDVDGNELYNTSNSGPDMFNSQIVAATDARYIVRYIGIHPIHETIDKTEPVVFHGGRRVDFGWPHDWQYAVTALAFLIFIGALFGAKTAHYGAITVVIFAFMFKWIGWLNETNTSTLLVILAAVIAFGWSLRKSEEVKQ